MNNPPITISGLNESLKFYTLWQNGFKGEGSTIAVLDTGIDRISDLEKTIIINKDFTEEDDPRDHKGNEHGTKIAKLIHAIAPKARIANLKVIPHNKDPEKETVKRAIQFCIDQYPSFKIINLSIYFKPGCGGLYRDKNTCDLCATVNDAVDKGIFAVAAAGNEGPNPGTITCPGSCERALTVGSSWKKITGEWWEALPFYKKFLLTQSGEFGKSFGTSYSAAYASGGAALLLSAIKGVTPGELKQAMIRSALPIAPEFPKVVQFDKTFEYLSNYSRAKRALYFNAGNELAQKNKSSYMTSNLDFALDYIEYLINKKEYVKSDKELKEIQGYLFPGALPIYEQKINQLLILTKDMGRLAHLAHTQAGSGQQKQWWLPF